MKPIIFGEVLFDRFPDGNVVLGGAPFNVAWHLQAFGLSPLFISKIGNDPLGREIRNTMTTWGMDCSGLQLDSTHPTGTVEVSLTDNEPSFDIVEKRAYDFIDADTLPPLHGGSVIYHGSLALREEISRKALQKIKQLSSAPVFVDINLRPPWWTPTIIEQILQEARWLKLNEDELNRIVPGEINLEKRMDHLLGQYTLHYLVVTQGDKGATVITSKGERYQVNVDKTPNVIDTVGAGDAFSSILLLGQLKQWAIQNILERAQDFAGSMVGVRGATVNDKDFYQPFIESWKL